MTATPPLAPLAPVGPVMPAGPATAANLSLALLQAASAAADTGAASAVAEPAPQVSPLDALVQTAAASQGGLGPLFADLAAVLQSPNLPPAVQAVVARVLGLQLPVDPPPSADDLRQAVARSGLFLEAQLASGAPVADDDLKSALLALAEVLETYGGELAAPPGPTGRGPAPPYRGGPTQGQRAVAPDLASDAPAEAILTHLARLTSGAVARQVLMQAASAQRGPRGASRQDDAHWLFEIPMATPEGPAIAQFEIDKDAASPDQDEDQRVWRAGFSLDVGPGGPVHARLSLVGGRVRVALWAESPQTLSRLDAEKQALTEALQGDETMAEVVLLAGAPDAAPPKAGRFMDTAV